MIQHQILQITTGKGIAIHNITTQVQNFISGSGIINGQVLICSRHTTTAIAINEDETRLLRDIQAYLEKLAPKDDRYRHNDLHLRPNIPADEPMNAHSHLMAITLGNSETIPIHEGKLALGTYQSILLVELDGSRQRQVWCQAIGDYMERQKITAIQKVFHSRLDTLSHLLELAETHFAEDGEGFLQQRIAPDMFPFGTQIAFTCNQPRNFALWCLGQAADNLNTEVSSFAQAQGHIASTQELLARINVADDKLLEMHRLDFGQGMYIELSGLSYVDDFWMPNFYFHLTTAYNIMRMHGASIGKRDFMLHLVPLIKQL